MLNNKVVVVTGGAGLIGRSFVRAVVEQGGTAIVADFDAHAGLEFVSEVMDGAPRGEAHFINLDITSEASVVSMIDSLSLRFGRIDSLVNNAYPRNSNYGRKMEDVTYDDFCVNMSMHVGGYFNVLQKISAYFVKNGGGNIVNMASIYGFAPPRFSVYDGTKMTMPVEYAAIKSAIIHLTKYFAQYLKGNNIRVNCISPGGILNDQPGDFVSKYNSYASSKGMLDSTDLQGTLIYLLSDMSKYVNGHNVVVDDGWTL